MRWTPAVLCLLLLWGCGDDNESSDASPQSGDAGSDRGPNDGPDVRDVACVDESFMALMLFDEPASGRIREEGQGDEFVSFVDASGGGLSPAESYVYARFTDAGLEKVELSDEEAFESTEWHVAFRRYVIRLNSGVSGPGEVTAARTAPGTQLAELEQVPEDLQLRTEQYFTEDGCEYVPDTSGIGAPATALSSFWTYSSCVQMTGNVYVIALPDERYVKFQVLSYYTPEVQRTCDATGEAPAPSGAGSIRVRWAFLGE